MDDGDPVIRPMRESEYHLLIDFLYDAIFQPDVNNTIPREVIEVPEISIYIDDFGKEEDDYCLVAETDSKIVGAVWARILKGDDGDVRGYGYVDDETPELAISVQKDYRGKSIGMALMNAMINYLREKGYKATSLDVQKANRDAVRFYKTLGFEIERSKGESYLMVLPLNDVEEEEE